MNIFFFKSRFLRNCSKKTAHIWFFSCTCSIENRSVPASSNVSFFSSIKLDDVNSETFSAKGRSVL